VRVETVGACGWGSGVGDGSEDELELGAGGLGMVPEVDGVGDECGVLVFVAVEEGEDGGAAEVLALGGLGLATLAVGIDGAWVVDVVIAGMNSAVTSPPGTEIQWSSLLWVLKKTTLKTKTCSKRNGVN
jgi:hypothetical protein